MSKYNREEILQSGVEILTMKGFSGLGVQHVLKACGIPKGSFYNFFENKDAFVMEAIKLYNRKVKFILEQIDNDSTLNPIEKITKFYSISNDFFFNNSSLRTCPMMNIVSDGVENEAIIELIHSSIDMHKGFIAKWIESATTLELISNQIDPVRLTHMIYDNYHGAVLRMKYENSELPLNNFISNVLPFYLK